MQVILVTSWEMVLRIASRSRRSAPPRRRNVPVGRRAAGQCWLPIGADGYGVGNLQHLSMCTSVCFVCIYFCDSGWHDSCSCSGCVIHPGNECGITAMLLPAFRQAGCCCCLAGWCGLGRSPRQPSGTTPGPAPCGRPAWLVSLSVTVCNRRGKTLYAPSGLGVKLNC